MLHSGFKKVTEDYQTKRMARGHKIGQKPYNFMHNGEKRNNVTQCNYIML